MGKRGKGAKYTVEEKLRVLDVQVQYSPDTRPRRG